MLNVGMSIWNCLVVEPLLPSAFFLSLSLSFCFVVHPTPGVFNNPSQYFNPSPSHRTEERGAGNFVGGHHATFFHSSVYRLQCAVLYLVFPHLVYE